MNRVAIMPKTINLQVQCSYVFPEVSKKSPGCHVSLPEFEREGLYRFSLDGASGALDYGQLVAFDIYLDEVNNTEAACADKVIDRGGIDRK